MNKTPLCLLAEKYGADKCPAIGHQYTPFYYEYLKDRKDTIKKVLEVGVGNKRQIRLIPNGVIGASLKMWRDFFPNSFVYGADISPESIIEDVRLKTYYCNEMVKEDVEKLIATIGSDIDLVVDDASHHIDSQITLFKNLMPLLDKGVTYIVEDCRRTRMMRKTFPEYESVIPGFPANEHVGINDGVIIFKK